MSANTEMNIQMTANQKKNTNIDHKNVPNVHCTAHLQLVIVAVHIVDRRPVAGIIRAG
jgi:hypothetical protein